MNLSELIQQTRIGLPPLSFVRAVSRGISLNSAFVLKYN
jgi:hypothetical protein